MGIGSNQSSVRSWLVQPMKELLSAAGRCAGRGCALIRQLANLSETYLQRMFWVPMIVSCLSQIRQSLVCLSEWSERLAEFKQEMANSGKWDSETSNMKSKTRSRAFSVAGPAIWNWLKDNLRDPAVSRDSFEHSLKTFSFSTYLCT